MNPEPTVFVVDDDAAVRDALRLLLEEEGLPVEVYASAEAFLDSYHPERPGCLVLDIRMPGMNGLELQETLAALQCKIPIIFITGHGAVSLSVSALKAGALDFLEKPFDDEELLGRIRMAITLDASTRQDEAEASTIKTRFARLTPREKEVMALVVAGQSSREIATELTVSHRTVEVHRSRVMRKMEADSLLDLATMAVACGFSEPHKAVST